VQDLEALPLVEGLLLADARHRPGIGTVRAAADRHLVDDRRAVDEPADRAHVGPGQRRVVEDRGVLLLAGVQQVEQRVARDAEGLRGRVQVQAVAGLVLHLRDQDRLPAEARRPGDPVAFGLHADDLGVGVLGDLADQGLAVGLGHPVAGLDPSVGLDQRLEGLRQRLLAEGVGLRRAGRPVRQVRHARTPLAVRVQPTSDVTSAQQSCDRAVTWWTTAWLGSAP
jgi:hypothetical protein